MTVTSVSATSSVVGGFEPSDSGALDGVFRRPLRDQPDPAGRRRLRVAQPLGQHASSDVLACAAFAGRLHRRRGPGHALHRGQVACDPHRHHPSPTSTSAPHGVPAPTWTRHWTSSGHSCSRRRVAGRHCCPGESSNAEGQWYLHYTLFTSKGYAGAITQAVPFKVDLVKPRSVTNLQSSPTTNPARRRQLDLGEPRTHQLAARCLRRPVRCGLLPDLRRRSAA